jgi:hypothetical protein
MFEWASIVSGIVKAFNFITQWMKEKELVNTGKALQQGEQDHATLEKVKDAQDARNSNNDALDDELCLDKPDKADNH